MPRFHVFAILAAAPLVISCDRGEAARADSLAAVTSEQLALMSQLSAQKDSLTGVVLDADAFIAQIDSQISTVKGLPKSKRRESLESPVEEQLQQRKEMMQRVSALVSRTRQTAAQLAEARQLEARLRGEMDTLKTQNDSLRARAERDQLMIAQLGETIQRQTEQITVLASQVDSLALETRTLGSRHYQAYYVVGTEDELLKKGIVVREGGANLIVARIGRTVQPARRLDPSLFTPIDQRDVREIPIPDTTRRYRIISRQSLDNATVASRGERSEFRGALRITNAEKFWAPSRYLIIVQN